MIFPLNSFQLTSIRQNDLEKYSQISKLRQKTQGPPKGFKVIQMKRSARTPSLFNSIIQLSVSIFLTTGILIFTSPNIGLAQIYCSSAATNTVTYEYINEVTLNGASNTSMESNYSDYTGFVFTSLNAGTTYTFTQVAMLVTAGGPWVEYVKAWIDFNQDGDFDDPGEEIDMGSQTVSDTAIFTTDFAVPAGALAGNTRMRVILRYENAPVACGTYSWGETEDEVAIIAMLLDDYYQASLNEPPEEPASEAPVQQTKQSESRPPRRSKGRRRPRRGR